MKVVASAPGYNVDVRSRVTAIARIVSRCLNFEFLNCIGIGNGDAGVKTGVRSFVVTGSVVDGNAVHLKVVLLRIGTIHAHVFSAFAKGSSVRRGDGDTRGHSQNRGEVPRDKRQVADHVSGHGGA